MASRPGRYRALLKDRRNIQRILFDIYEPVIPPALFFRFYGSKKGGAMQGYLIDRRAVLKTISAVALVGAVAAQPPRAAPQHVKWPARTEAPKRRAPPHAADP